MIAIGREFCYCCFMKFGGLIIGCLFCAILALLTNLPNQLAMFFFIGKIPYLPISLPPFVMLAFWALLIPGIIFVRRTGGEVIWQTIESIGVANQRKINQQIRRFTAKTAPSYALFVTAGTMHLAFSQLKSKKSAAKKQVERRRFAPLPV